MKTHHFHFICAALAALIEPTDASGFLDHTFGNGGKVTTVLGGGGNDSDSRTSAALRNDGKIVVAGSAWNGINDDFVVARYNINGSLDTSFNGTGKVTTAFGSGYDRGYDRGYSLVAQNDGKIIVAGYLENVSNYDFALVRYNADGSLDTTFNGTGRVTTDIGNSNDVGNSVALQGDGRIVVAGKTQVGGGPSAFALARYNSNGSLDASFNGTGKVATAIGGSDAAANSVAVQGDGKIVAAGYSNNGIDYDFELVRYNADGSLDTTFNGTGKVATNIGGGNDEGFSIAIQVDGKIVVAGTSFISNLANSVLARYNTNGSLDTSFNGTGKVTTVINGSNTFGRSVAVQNDGKIVVAGSAHVGGNWDFAFKRYNADGTPDAGVNNTGIVTTDIGGVNEDGFSVVLQDDGKIVVAGHSWNSDHEFALVRYEIAPDTDGDGFSDAAEARFGTLADNANSRPAVSASQGGSGINLRFPSVAGRQYRIEYANDLGEWRPLTTINAVASETVYIDTSALPVKRFYRVAAL